MDNLASLKAVVQGKVQAVGFRYYTQAEARRLGITGYVRNLPGGNAVEAAAEGEQEKLEKFLDFLAKGPPLARVDTVETDWAEYTGAYSEFSITR